MPGLQGLKTMKIKGWNFYRWGVASPSLYHVSLVTGLKPEHRHWGRQDEWHAGAHCFFGLWFFDVSWSLPWSAVKDASAQKGRKGADNEPT
jgi:hypothetical protein